MGRSYGFFGLCVIRFGLCDERQEKRLARIKFVKKNATNCPNNLTNDARQEKFNM